MRRSEFPIVTFVSLVVLALVATWQVHRAVEFSDGLQAVHAVKDRPFSGRGLARIELPELAEEPRQGCFTVFRPPTAKSSHVYPDGFMLLPRPKFRLMKVGEKGVELELNGDGMKVVGLRRGGYFHFQGERYYLIDVKTNQVTLQRASNRLRITAFAGVDPRKRHEHHL